MAKGLLFIGQYRGLLGPWLQVGRLMNSSYLSRVPLIEKLLVLRVSPPIVLGADSLHHHLLLNHPLEIDIRIYGGSLRSITL